MLTRRTLLQSALTLTASTVLAQGTGGDLKGSETEQLSVPSTRPLSIIPADFIGLGYEMSSAARVGLLSAQNAFYVQLVRNLGAQGVIRIGGIVADFASYTPQGNALAEPQHTVVTRPCLQQLRGFLDATHWRTIWSLNFGRGTLEAAIFEATEVARILGSRLLAFELGNEVENYSRGKEPRRVPPYDYQTYRAEYLRWRTALLAALPTLRLAAPDTASSVEWIERTASDAHGDVQLLTTHYYRGDQRQGTRDQLLQPDAKLVEILERLRIASRRSGIPWRMCETNSFFGGGRPGVSDTLAAALWTLDYMLLLAQYGCAGVNLETGVNQLGFLSSYSPIEDNEPGHPTAGASYYGMLAFAAATADAPTVMAVTRDQESADLAVYALGHEDRVRSLVLINKAAETSVAVPLHGLAPHGASALSLRGPSLDSKSGITLGGAAVDEQGHWHARPEPVSSRSILVPPATALILRM